MCELATVVQEELDVKIAIINNGYLGMVRQWQEFFYERAMPRRRSRARLREAGRGVRDLRAATVDQRAGRRGRSDRGARASAARR